MRDNAFAQLGDTDLSDMEIPDDRIAPPYTIAQPPTHRRGENGKIARTVEGKFAVPCYHESAGLPDRLAVPFPPGSTPAGLPGQHDGRQLHLPDPPRRDRRPDADPARPSLYGHGLLGTAGEVTGGNIGAMANEHNLTFCATDWAGFSTGDVPTIAAIAPRPLAVPEARRPKPAGLRQLHVSGPADDPPRRLRLQPRVPGRAPPGAVIDTERLYYDGNSQGGILGGSLTALAPDFDRAVLGVPGMNYSTLLRRSSDFHPYAEGEFTGVVCDELPSPFKEICESAPGDTPLGLYDNYPNELERPLILSLMQLQWDRAEANGYAHHITGDPLPDTPPHDVLMHVAFGDHQVSQWTAEFEARTIGASVNWPAVDEGRHPDDQGPADDPLFGLPQLGSSDYPFGGSALIYWDSGAGVVTPAADDQHAAGGYPQTERTPTATPQHRRRAAAEIGVPAGQRRRRRRLRRSPVSHGPVRPDSLDKPTPWINFVDPRGARG